MADPLPDRQQRYDQAKDLHDALSKLLDENGTVPLLRDYVASKASVGLAAVEPIIAHALSVLVTLMFPFAKSILQTVADVRKTEQPEFNEVTVEVLNEILGTDLTSDDVPVGKGAAGTRERSAAVGKKLYDVLTQMFTPDGAVTPESGEKAAQAFTGFCMNWSMSSAFLAILGGCLPEVHLDELKELGEELARNLGLERLQRRTLGVLMDNCVQKPYDAALRKRFRPDTLSDAQYVRAWQRGEMDESYVTGKLAEKGYPDKEIEQIKLENIHRLSDSDLSLLVRFGELPSDIAFAELIQQGMPRDRADLVLKANTLSRVNTLVSSYVNKIESQYLNGFIDEDTFNKLLDAVPWTDEEKQWERNFVGVTLDAPQTTLTFAQVKAGIVNGILDFNYLDRWMINQGYSDDDQLYLEFEILQAMDKPTPKDQIVQAKAERRATAPVTSKVAPAITRT